MEVGAGVETVDVMTASTETGQVEISRSHLPPYLLQGPSVSSLIAPIPTRRRSNSSLLSLLLQIGKGPADNLPRSIFGTINNQKHVKKSRQPIDAF